MSGPLKATAAAHPNIALVKYWGKRDEALVLPHNSSLSVTLAPLQVITTVQFQAEREQVELNGILAEPSERDRVLATIDRVRAAASISLGAVRVASRGNFPAAAGLASSAAGFAALAVAASAAAGLPSNARDASRLARLGSGSAARSIQGGTCIWRRGERPDGEDSFADQLFAEDHWPELRFLAVVFESERKGISSREGMRRSVQTSPFYAAWAIDAEAELSRAAERIQRRDLLGLGEIAERNAWRMHAVALSADPPVCYFAPSTVRLILSLAEQRKKRLAAWFTLDAGPNPFILTDAAHEAEAERLARACGAREVIRCIPGGGARVLNEDLF